MAKEDEASHQRSMASISPFFFARSWAAAASNQLLLRL
jgi:hypothetical protein